MHTIATSLYNTLLKLISPPFCARCGGFLSKRLILCEACRQRIQPVVSTTVPVTKKYQITLLALCRYEEPIKSLVLAKSRRDHVASAQIGQLVWELTNLKNMPFDCIVPIPLHWRRFAERGYNQSYEMARIIAQKSDKPIVNALRRTTHRPFQSQVNQKQRQENVRGAFTVHSRHKNLITGKRILIVDDLFTTGATMKTAARELVRARPAQLIAIVACRTS